VSRGPVEVIASVDVIDTVIVAVHVHGNDTVGVIWTRGRQFRNREHRGRGLEVIERAIAMLTKMIDP
jgi:hypothetical protein